MTTIDEILPLLASLSEEIKDQRAVKEEMKLKLKDLCVHIEKLKEKRSDLESKMSKLVTKQKENRQEANAIRLYARQCWKFINTEFNERPNPAEATLMRDYDDYFSLTPEVRTEIEKVFGSNISELADFITNEFNLFKSSEDLVFKLPKFTEMKEKFGQEAIIAVAHIIKIGSVYVSFTLETTSNNFVGVFANEINETLQLEFNIPDDEIEENEKGRECHSFYELTLNGREIDSSTWYLGCLKMVYYHQDDCLENEEYGIDISSEIELFCGRVSPRFVGLR